MLATWRGQVSSQEEPIYKGPHHHVLSEGLRAEAKGIVHGNLSLVGFLFHLRFIGILRGQPAVSIPHQSGSLK